MLDTDIDLTSTSDAMLAGYNVLDGGGPDSITWTVNGAARPLGAGSSLRRLRFKRGMVTFDRPWLDPAILRYAGWHVPGVRAGLYSTGSLDSNDGMFPLLVAGMIIAADVEISGSWAPEDREIVKTAIRTKTPINLGPFTLGGPSPAGQPPPSLDFASGTVSVPGVQVYGFWSGLVPLTPAVDG
jgi:hypothetical protein